MEPNALALSDTDAAFLVHRGFLVGTETEERIKSAFDSLSSGRTTIIIAHRLSTIVDADQILVLSGGTIVESGTHHELLHLDGRYASMWRKQSRAQQAQEEAEELRKQAKSQSNTPRRKTSGGSIKDSPPFSNKRLAAL